MTLQNKVPDFASETAMLLQPNGLCSFFARMFFFVTVFLTSAACGMQVSVKAPFKVSFAGACKLTDDLDKTNEIIYDNLLHRPSARIL